MSARHGPGRGRPSPPPRKLIDRLYDPRWRGVAAQVLVGALLAWGMFEVAANVARNLEAQGIASGFGFLDRTAGFDISMSLIPYANTMTYARAFFVGLTNTLLVAALGIVFATLIGFSVGIARLSENWLIRTLAASYVEVIRNIPPLLMLFAVYFGVLKNLPQPRDSLALPLGSFLNIRGLFVPAPLWQPAMWIVLAAVVAGCLATWLLHRHAARELDRTGDRPLVWPWAIALVVLLPAIVGAVSVLAFGPLATFDMPTPGRFNIAGGISILPELVALLVGLSLYTAAFIAEIVRAGIAGVPTGQREAASALGLSTGQTLRLVTIPLALRIIIPPLTNQYLNLTKNSSLAVAIGYPDLVSVFAGTVLNQTNQAIEVVTITMAVYLTLSLMTSVAMNRFNDRMAIKER
ncbi:MAG: amino acid ABC transporter permease [Hyphomicrobiaceae bacterium]|nr:amino acid ABC transporter permease [Hyphomicrobiaceae bacterium]